MTDQPGFRAITVLMSAVWFVRIVFRDNIYNGHASTGIHCCDSGFTKLAKYWFNDGLFWQLFGWCVVVFITSQNFTYHLSYVLESGWRISWASAPHMGIQLPATWEQSGTATAAMPSPQAVYICLRPKCINVIPSPAFGSESWRVGILYADTS